MGQRKLEEVGAQKQQTQALGLDDEKKREHMEIIDIQISPRNTLAASVSTSSPASGKCKD